MKELYKCEADGKVFEDKLSCLKYEFELSGGKENLKKILDETFALASKIHDLQINLLEYDAKIVGVEVADREDIVGYFERRYFEFDVFKDGERLGETFYFEEDDPISKEKLYGIIVERYVHPYLTVLQGEITFDTEGSYYGEFKVGEVEINKVLRKNMGETVKITIDYN